MNRKRKHSAVPVAAPAPSSAPVANDPWRNPLLGPCACSQLRRTSRAVSSLYDNHLARVGLTVTQYAVLVTIARAHSISKTTLAELLGMDRTTLTRTLQPLERDGLLREQDGEDRRERQVLLTAKGRRKVDSAFLCWSKAQSDFLASFGAGRFDQLRLLLRQASQSAQQAGGEA